MMDQTIIHLDDQINRFSFFFLFQNKIETDVYIFLYNTIRYFSYEIGSTLLFCNNSLHNNVYYDEYSRFFSVRAPRTALFQYVNWGNCQRISYSSPLSKSLSLSETLQIRVSHTWKIMNWLSIVMIFVTVVPRFIHSHLPKSESRVEVESLLIALCVAEWQPHWGVLKGSWLSNQFESYL